MKKYRINSDKSKNVEKLLGCNVDILTEGEPSFNTFKALGLIDIWYNEVKEPVQQHLEFVETNSYRVGDVVFVKECNMGSHGAKNKLGVVSDDFKVATNGCIPHTYDHIRVRINSDVWDLGPKSGVVLLCYSPS